jgi:8-oxo-dGTP pyrophosphatase MutT (NUDIX family)
MTTSSAPELDTTTRLRPANAAAALLIVDGRYLLQLRDNKTGIFFPNHWGCFGGALDPGETPEQTLIREVREELGLALKPGAFSYFMQLEYDLNFANLGRMWRRYFEIVLPSERLQELRLGEGAGMRLFAADEILTGSVLFTPYDAFVLWFHINRARLSAVGAG